MSFSKQNWISASILLVAVAIISKGLGFFREILIAYYFGASMEVDAFMVALSLPMLLAGMIGIAFSTGLVPSYHQASLMSIQRAEGVIWSAVLLAIGLSILFLVPLVVAPRFFVHLVAPSLPEATSLLAADLARWLAGYVLGLNLVYLLTAAYHAVHHFKIPAIADLAFNIATILFLFGYAATLSIQALVLGNLVGIALCVMILAAFLAKSSHVMGGLRVEAEHNSLIILLVWPILVMEVLTQLGGMAENYYASNLNEGSIAAIAYAKKITTTIVTLLAVNLARGLFPTLSVMTSQGRGDEAMALLRKVNMQLVVVVLPIAVCLICYRQEILRALYFRGAFDAAGLNMTSQAFIFYAGWLLIAVIEPVLIMTSYAFSDTFPPLALSLTSLVAMLIFLEIFTPLLGIGGIALSMGLACLVRVAALAAYFEKRARILDLKGISKMATISLGCSLLAFTPLSFLWRHPYGHVLEVVLAISISFVLYVVVAFLFMRKEMNVLWRGLYEGLGYSSRPSMKKTLLGDDQVILARQGTDIRAIKS